MPRAPLGFPFVRIGDKIVVGYQPDVYAKLMGIKIGN